MPDTETHAGEATLERPPPSQPLAVASVPRALPPAPACANCEHPLVGPFCSNCGQHIADYHRSVWRFVVDFLDNTICWDNKLLRTLSPLFKQPGFLTREFMRGHRVRYVHPLRLFLFTSAVCLTLLQFGHNELVVIDTGGKGHQAKRGLNFKFGDLSSPSSTAAPASPTTAPAPAPAAVPTVTPASADDKDDGDDADPAAKAIKHAVADKLAAAGKSLDDQPGQSDDALDQAVEAKVRAVGGSARLSRAISDGVQHRLSWVALALLPIFAMGLRALYWRSDSFYFEHLIFSLHYHTFLFLFWTVYVTALTVASWLPLHGLFQGTVRLALLGPPVYLYLALRGMYGNTRKRTVVKVLLLGSMHLLAIVIGVAAVGAAAFFSAR